MLLLLAPRRQQAEQQTTNDVRQSVSHGVTEYIRVPRTALLEILEYKTASMHSRLRLSTCHIPTSLTWAPLTFSAQSSTGMATTAP